MKILVRPQSSAVRVFFKLLLVWMLLLGNASFLQAQVLTAVSPAEIKYVGMVDNNLVFNISLTNEELDGFTLEIKDGQGYQFFFGKFKEKGFRKFYAIDRSELGNNTIRFELISKGKVQKQEFEITSSPRLVDETTVVKR